MSAQGILRYKREIMKLEHKENVKHIDKIERENNILIRVEKKHKYYFVAYQGKGAGGLPSPSPDRGAAPPSPSTTLHIVCRGVRGA